MLCLENNGQAVPHAFGHVHLRTDDRLAKMFLHKVQRFGNNAFAEGWCFISVCWKLCCVCCPLSTSNVSVQVPSGKRDNGAGSIRAMPASRPGGTTRGSHVVYAAPQGSAQDAAMAQVCLPLSSRAVQSVCLTLQAQGLDLNHGTSLPHTCHVCQKLLLASTLLHS